MVEMTTRSAQKQSASSAIAFVIMPTLGARSARIARINWDHRNPSQFCLEFDESAQFGERPFRHLVSLSLPEPSPFADAGQVFKADPAFGVCGFLNDLFREAFAQIVVEVLLKSDLVGGLHFKGLLGEPGAGMVKPLHRGFELIGLLSVWQKLNLQSQFHQCALCRQIGSIARRLSPLRFGDAKFLSSLVPRLAT